MNKIFTICATGIVALAATSALAGDGYYSYTGPGGGAYRSGGAYAQDPTNSRATNPNANKSAYQQMMGQISGNRQDQLNHDPTESYYESLRDNEGNPSYRNSSRGQTRDGYGNGYDSAGYGQDTRSAYPGQDPEPQYGGNKSAYERMMNKTNERREAMREQESRAIEAESHTHAEGADASPYARHRSVFRSPSQQVRTESNSNYGHYGR